MPAIALLTSADVAVIAGDANSVVDLTETRPFSRLTVTGGGTNAELSPVGADAPERLPMSATHTLTAEGFAGDRLDALGALGPDAMTAVVLGASNRGWVIPATIFDAPADDAAARFTNTDVAMVDLMWDNHDRGYIIRNAVPLVADGNVHVALVADAVVILALTVAGSVDGVQRTVGVYVADAIDGATPVVGARGWALVAVPDTPAGVA